jgi:predicted TIM-barrel fold metal-dependent hydrolase
VGATTPARPIECDGPDPAPRPPARPPPPGSWDCHAHVFGPASRFPYVAGRVYTPPDATLDAYLHVLDVLGLQHGLLLQPTVYGQDNACMIDALQRSNGRLRGVVVADPRRLSDDTIAQWTRAGVRGIRINMLAPPILPVDQIGAITGRLAEIGWHLSLVPEDIDRLADLEPVLRRAACPVVIEQMGHMQAERTEAPGFTALLRLLADRDLWVKLSHPYQLKAAEAPYHIVGRLARSCVAAAPDRCVWASDWPHVMVDGDMPNDGFLLDLLDDWLDGDAALRQSVLADTPAALFA